MLGSCGVIMWEMLYMVFMVFLLLLFFFSTFLTRLYHFISINLHMGFQRAGENLLYCFVYKKRKRTCICHARQWPTKQVASQHILNFMFALVPMLI